MPKISIYVPDAIKSRMDGAGDRANWSAVAQKAFENELNHLDSVKEVKSMNEVIERLRASKEKTAQELEKQGRLRGVEWAKHYAKYDELKCISQLSTNDFYQSWEDDPDWAAANQIAETVFGDRLTLEELVDFYGVEKDMFERVVTDEFLEAFVTSATEIWEQVKDEV